MLVKNKKKTLFENSWNTFLMKIAIHRFLEHFVCFFISFKKIILCWFFHFQHFLSTVQNSMRNKNSLFVLLCKNLNFLFMMFFFQTLKCDKIINKPWCMQSKYFNKHNKVKTKRSPFRHCSSSIH